MRNRTLAGLSAVALTAAAWATTAVAQTAPDVTAAGASMTIRDMWQYGGWLMYVLAAMSVGTLTLVLYFFAVLRPNQVAPESLRKTLTEVVRRGDLEEARRVCDAHPCPLAAVTLVGLDYQRDARPAVARVLQDVMEGEGARQADNLQGQPQYLMDLAVLSPMVGLLGSVFGMMHAFNVVALDAAKAKPLMLATGVSQALVNTCFGLLIGIPAMGFYGHFRRRAARMVSALEAASTDVLIALLGKIAP